MMADKNIPWYRDVDGLGKAYNQLAGLKNPWHHGAAWGAAGYLGGKALQPALDWLYPGFDFDSEWLPVATGLLGAGAGYGISRLAYPKKASTRLSWAKLASSMLKGQTIDPRLLPRPLATLAGSGMLSPGGAVAFQSMASASAGGNPTTPGRIGGTAGSVLGAVGSYLNPVNRLGWGLAGMGASMLTRGTGVESGLGKVTGMPTGEAFRRFGPLVGAGMRLAGY